MNKTKLIYCAHLPKNTTGKNPKQHIKDSFKIINIRVKISTMCLSEWQFKKIKNLCPCKKEQKEYCDCHIVMMGKDLKEYTIYSKNNKRHLLCEIYKTKKVIIFNSPKI